MTDSIPKFFWLKQKFDAAGLKDPAFAVQAAFKEVLAAQLIEPGMTVAVGAGSRGITNYDVIVRAVCQELKALGAKVFIVPAMGSHGGATAEGQLDVLHHYGITEAAMGVPIRSSMDVVELGRVGELIVYQDKIAAITADAIVLVNRIKPHTDFHGPVESGLMKMAAIGLGKQKGAAQFHQDGFRVGHAKALTSVAREVIQRSKITFGIGILENQLHETAKIIAVPARDFEAREIVLLEEARRLMPRLPFNEVDLLVVDEMGKNLSGTGMDTNVIGRTAVGGVIVQSDVKVRVLYVRSLHPYSYGNAAGVGVADFIHDRLFKAIDFDATQTNVITSLMTGNARIPMHFSTDRKAMETAVFCTGRALPSQARSLWIKNTLSCEKMLASEAFLPELASRSDLAQESDPQPLALDAAGDFMPVFNAA